MARGGKGARKVLSKIVYTEEDLAKYVLKNAIRITEADLKTILKLTGGRADLCESILLSTKEIIFDKSIDELVKIFKIKKVPKPNSLSNYQARIWYTWRKAGIETEIENISNIEKKAKKAFDLRNEYRTETRQYMNDRALAEYLEEVEKNQEWEKFLNYVSNKDEIRNIDEAYQYIIQKSQTGRDGVDTLFKLK